MDTFRFLIERWKRTEPFVFHHRLEIFTAFILLIILTVSLIPGYQAGRNRTQLTGVYRELSTLVGSLLLYSSENPRNRVFSPDPGWLNPGIVLCPLQPPEPARLSFLTTPAAFIPRPPRDPFVTEAMKRSDCTPFILHWVKSNCQSPGYTHIAWGAFSVGPSLSVPPKYDFSVMRRTPYEARPLRFNLFNLSNGLLSSGFLYHDSFGNTTPI